MPRSKDENACRRRRRRRRRTRAKIKIPPLLRNISCGVTLGRWREMRKEGTYTHTHIPHTHPTFFSPLHEQKTAISAHPNFIASLPFVIACVRRRLWIRSHTHTSPFPISHTHGDFLCPTWGLTSSAERCFCLSRAMEFPGCLREEEEGTPVQEFFPN